VSALLDISIGYAEGAPVWPGDTPFSCGWTARREDGSSVNLASLHTSAHAGTHADAPLHVESAWSASESLPVDAFMGPAVVVALPELHAWPTLDERGARWIVERGIELFGVDAPSVDARESTTLPVHHALFAGGAYVLENLALDAVAPGHYELFAQPLLVVGADAAPVRALLRARRNEAPRSDARPRD
jgi:arylformamidase